MLRKTSRIWLLAAGGLIGAALAVARVVLADREGPAQRLPWPEVRLLAEVLERVKREYVDPVDDAVLFENAIRGMVTQLDPHSQLLSADEYEEIRISTQGNYSGVGLEVHMRDGRVRVVSPIEGTPAAVAGLMPGDVILSIDGVEVDDRNISDAIARLRGEPGTRVMLTVEREYEPGPLNFTLVRSRVQMPSVRAQLLDSNYGYLRISQFAETTPREVRRAVAGLRAGAADGLRGLILDLRNNPGGVLEAAVEVADDFLDAGLIVSATGRARDATFRFDAREGDLLRGARIIVLVNAGSASAAEIVAGALRDNGRGLIAGHRTFGKGSVQTVMPLSDGRAIKLTTSHYYTPSGASIQGLGIEPDVTLDDAAFADALANTGRHETDPGAALLSRDTQIREALGLLKDSRLAQTAL